MGPDFELDDAQEALVRLAGEVLSDNSARGGADTAERLWKSLAQAGLLGLAVPSELGGAGLGAMETGLLLMEIGRHAARVPAFSTLALGVLPLARWGSPAQQRDLLPRVLEGQVLTAALGPPIPATRDWRTTGTVHSVPDADRAYRVLVPVSRAAPPAPPSQPAAPSQPAVPSPLAAPSPPAVPPHSADRTFVLPEEPGRPSEQGPSAPHPADRTFVLVDPGGPGVTLRRTPTSGGTDEFTIVLDGAQGEPVTGADPNRYAIAGAAALAAGALAGALEMTADHVRDRHQFGRPLATFQAVAQQIADVYIASRTMHLAALAASWNVDDEDDQRTAALWLSSEALPALRTCHHLHGGLGLSADYPLHRHTALVRDLVRQLGAHGVHRPD
jgi:alkylation response protein AidB-like acyl-CoA dehydrogenase